MAGLITVGGLATGLDTNNIIDQLVQLERRPLDLLGQQIAAVQATQASVASFGSKLGALRTAAEDFKTVDAVLVRTASSSDEGVLSAAAGGGAPRGATTITVTQLARGSVAGATTGVAALTSTVASGAGTLQFQVGTGAVQTVAVDGSTTLQGLADAINQLDAGVTASAINLGTSASPDFRLQIVSQNTGATSTVAVLHDDTTLGVQASQAGQDAQFTVSGFTGTFTREANTFSDVLTGVTISLTDVGTATVTVRDDADKVVDKVKSLVGAFNDLVTFVAGESDVQESKDKSQLQVGSLAADSTVRRLTSRLHDLFSEPLAGATGPYVNLSSLGLATQEDGTIRFDESKFRTALAADPTGVAQVFAGNGTAAGVANDLATLADQATGAGGVLATHTSALNDEVRSLQDQIDAGQRAVDAFEVNVRAQFASLETLVSKLQSQGNFLLSALGK